MAGKFFKELSESAGQVTAAEVAAKQIYLHVLSLVPVV